MMGAHATGPLEAALAQGERLLAPAPAAAAEQAREILRITPGCSAAHRLMARALRRLGRIAEAERAESAAIEAAMREPLLAGAAQALLAGRWQEAEAGVRRRLDEWPEDPAALAMLAEIAAEVGAYEAAKELLDEALRHAPRFADARLALAKTFFAQGRVGESLAAAKTVLDEQPDCVAALTWLGATFGQIGAYQEAIDIYETHLSRHPAEASVWLAYGHVLKTTGRTEDGIAAYRRALALEPSSGETWWSLANLKTGALGQADAAKMTRMLEDGAARPVDRIGLHFALGRAHEEAGESATSFAHYAEGNRLQRAALPYDSAITSKEAAKAKALFSEAFFSERAGWGEPAPDPIFIIGLPRAGSTLIEQILASHSMIEGTAELPYIPALIRELAATRSVALRTPYPEILALLERDEAQALGRAYLARAAVHRRAGRPFFIDKLPNNWLDIGLIHLILPNAKIVDARRAPLACCWSNYKQLFAAGQAFSYDLADLGYYYRDYVALLDHYDRVLPGRVHRVEHEALVAAPEREVRRLLDHLGLAFEPACLNFHENARPVRTASSEQVRRPISGEGLERWRAFEPWLQPLKEALGPALVGAGPEAGPQ